MFSTKWFDGFEDLKDSFEIRREVFCKEQGISEELEFDGSDSEAVIVVVYEDNNPVATGRVIRIENEMRLGRIAVKSEHRGKRYGDLVVRMLIRRCYDMGAEEQYVHAQVQAKGFYERLGFVPYGDEYMEDGILHISMKHIGDTPVCGR